MTTVPEDIKQAISQAENAGYCRYSKGCVIAQLAAIHNDGVIPVFPNDTGTITRCDNRKVLEDLGIEYNASCLSMLQQVWDDSGNSTEEEAKQAVLDQAHELNWVWETL